MSASEEDQLLEPSHDASQGVELETHEEQATSCQNASKNEEIPTTELKEPEDGYGMVRHPPVDLYSGRVWALLVSGLSLFIYYKTLTPSISGGDSGEVMGAACSWGPAHPPGYPLFVFLANVAMRLFKDLGENKAYRVNLMCSIFTSIGVYNLHRATKIMTNSCAAATVAAGMYAFSPLIWNNALQAEVFSLNNLFVNLLTHILVRYLARAKHDQHSTAYWGAFICGLGLSNQHTLVLYEAIIVPVVFFSGWRRLLRPLEFLLCTLLFILGLTPYSHMWILEGCPIPWAEKDDFSLGVKYCPQFVHVPRYSWGDRRSFTGFYNHLLRKDYGTFTLAASGTDAHGKPVSLGTGLLYYFEDAAGPLLAERRSGPVKSYEGQLLYIGVPFALLGLVLCTLGRPLGRNLAASRTLVVCYVWYLIFFHSLANLPIRVPLFLAVHARFWQMPNSTMFLFVGVGFEFACRYFARRRSKSLGFMARWLGATFLVGMQLLQNYETQDNSKNYAMDHLTRTAINTAPPNSIIMSSGDLQFNPGLYMTICEGVRPDIHFMSLQLMSYRWYGHNSSLKWPGVVFPGKSHWPDQHGYSLQKFYEANIFDRQIFSYGGNRPAENLERLLEDPSLHEEQFYHFPYGLLDRMIPTHLESTNIHRMASDFARAFKPMEDWEKEGLITDMRIYGDDSWEDQVAREYFLAYHRFGHACWEHFLTLPGESCAGACPEGCDCDYSMGKALSLVRHSYTKLHEWEQYFISKGLEVPFNWDGAVQQYLGKVEEQDGNAVGMLWYWSRYLDKQKKPDIEHQVIQRKVTRMQQQAIGIAPYEPPDPFS